MPSYNTTFELSVDDLEIIEAALRDRQRGASDKVQDETSCPRVISDLLGRLHNQKIHYRPRKGVYVGG